MQNKTMNLGLITEPLLVFGGSYSNLQALQALRKESERLGIPPSRCICTGDIVAYCGKPFETTELIRDWGVHCLMGNCEESFADNADDCGCGFSEGTQCDLLSAQWFRYANTQLTNDQRQWFATLPQQIRLSINGIDTLLVHGSISSMNQFIFPSTNDDVFAQESQLTDAALIIGGHSGIPFYKEIPSTNKSWLNTGAIGMPANDGSQNTWFSVITPQKNNAKNTITIEQRELIYEAQSAANDMNNAKLNNGYSHALLSGLWPSMDVLPEQERQQQGKAIQTATYTLEHTL